MVEIKRIPDWIGYVKVNHKEGIINRHIGDGKEWGDFSCHKKNTVSSGLSKKGEDWAFVLLENSCNVPWGKLEVCGLYISESL